MSGQQERQDFVAQLAVGHAAAVFVAGGHQHGEQVAGVLSAGAALANDAVHNFVEFADCSLHPNHGRDRHMAHDGRQNHAASGSVAHQGIERGRDALCVGFYLHPEEHFGHDPHSELHHFLMDVADIAVLPRCQHFFGESGHLYGHKTPCVRDGRRAGTGDAAVAILNLRWSTGLRPETSGCSG